MSNIEIFQDITTEDVLLSLEADAEKYTGLYVDMNEAEGRKYVKDQASKITDMLKALDRARIDKSKAYKQSVESVAKSIRERLEKANEPYSLLIDEYKIERKKVLDAENARKQAIADAEQLELDHELALLMDLQWDSEKDKRAAEKAAEVERVAEQARQELLAKQQQEADYAARLEAARKSDEEAAELRRVNDIEHRRAVNVQSVNELVSCGVDSELAMTIIKALANNKLTYITINY